MHPTEDLAYFSGALTRPLARCAQPARALSLGELVERVAALVPEEDVAATVAALFERGMASFAALRSDRLRSFISS